MAESLSWHKLPYIILGVIVLALVLFFVLSNTNVLKEGFLGQLKDKKEVKLSADLPFYNEFAKNYQECKLSPDTECFCPLTNTYLPDNYILEIQNNADLKATKIILYANVQPGSSCGRIQSTDPKNVKNAVITDIGDDVVYFKDYIFRLSLVEPLQKENPSSNDLLAGIYRKAYTKSDIKPYDEFAKLIESDFTQVDSLFLSGNNLCTLKDVNGKDSVDFKSGFLYKFNNEKTALASGSYNLKRCAIMKNSAEAEKEFNKALSKLNQCEVGPCSYIVKSQNTDMMPAGYSLRIEDNGLILSYNNKIIKTSEIKKNLCLFDDFRNINPSQAKELKFLDFNGYVEIEIHPFSDNLCLLPYTLQMIQDKKLGLQKPLVPE